jgi:hypothetical protein
VPQREDCKPTIGRALAKPVAPSTRRSLLDKPAVAPGDWQSQWHSESVFHRLRTVFHPFIDRFPPFFTVFTVF